MIFGTREYILVNSVAKACCNKPDISTSMVQDVMPIN